MRPPAHARIGFFDSLSVTPSRSHRDRVDCEMPTSLLRELALRPPGTDILTTKDRLNSSEKYCMCPYALCPRFFPWGYTPRGLPPTHRGDNYPDTAGNPPQLLQPPILPLQLFQPLGLLSAHAPVEFAPAIVGLTGDREFAAYRLKTLPLARNTSASRNRLMIFSTGKARLGICSS